MWSSILNYGIKGLLELGQIEKFLNWLAFERTEVLPISNRLPKYNVHSDHKWHRCKDESSEFVRAAETSYNFHSIFNDQKWIQFYLSKTCGTSKLFVNFQRVEKETLQHPTRDIISALTGLSCCLRNGSKSLNSQKKTRKKAKNLVVWTRIKNENFWNRFDFGNVMLV